MPNHLFFLRLWESFACTPLLVPDQWVLFVFIVHVSLNNKWCRMKAFARPSSRARFNDGFSSLNSDFIKTGCMKYSLDPEDYVFGTQEKPSRDLMTIHMGTLEWMDTIATDSHWIFVTRQSVIHRRAVSSS